MKCFISEIVIPSRRPWIGIDVNEQEAEIMPVDGIEKMPMSANDAHDTDVVQGHNLSQWPVSYADIVRGDRVEKKLESGSAIG